MKMYSASDFVKVVDEQGTELPSVPKTWIGKYLLPDGVKRASRTATSTTAATETTGTEPAGNASTEEWAAYAKTKGATDADLVASDGNPLGRDELRAAYGTPAS